MPANGCHCKNVTSERSLDPSLCEGFVCASCGTYSIRFHRNQPWNQHGQDERARSSKHPSRDGKMHKNKHRPRRPGEPRASAVKRYFVDPDTLR